MARPKKESTAGDAAVRERLISAALALFSQKGYSATSVREIVEATGVSKPVLYYYFHNKEGIYLAIMENAYTIFEQQIEEISGSAGSSRERIIYFVQGLFDAFVEHLPIVRLIYSIYFGPPQGAPFFNLDRFHDRMLEVVDELVSGGIEIGEVRTCDIREMTWLITGCLITVVEEHLCRQEPRIDRNGLERMLNLIFEGIAEGDAQ